MFEQLEVLKFYLYYRYFLPKNRCFRNRKALRRRQKRRLRRHLRYVAEHSPLYRGMKKFSSYPVIDKAFMMEHFHRLNTVGISREEAQKRLRRKAFYQRWGMEAMDFRVLLFGVEMELLVYRDRVEFDEYHEILEHVLSPGYGDRVVLV